MDGQEIPGNEPLVKMRSTDVVAFHSKIRLRIFMHALVMPSGKRCHIAAYSVIIEHQNPAFSLQIIAARARVVRSACEYASRKVGMGVTLSCIRPANVIDRLESKSLFPFERLRPDRAGLSRRQMT